MAIDMSVLTDRLAKVRTAIVRSVLFLLAGAIVVYVFSEDIMQELLRHLPVGSRGQGLVFLSPSEAFVTRIKLAFAGGLVVAIPFILLQIWSFARPFLQRRQRINLLLLIPVAFGLFLAGGAFGYFLLLPIALRFLLGFSGPDLEPMLAVAPYIGFVIMLILPLGLIFQMPVVAVFLARIGVIDPRSLAARRKYAILIIFIVSAVLTPPDVFSQLLMAAPLLLLFEISLLVARLATRKRSQRE